jgi:hypothetical protein
MIAKPAAQTAPTIAAAIHSPRGRDRRVWRPRSTIAAMSSSRVTYGS